MFVFIIGFVVTFFVIHLANIKLAKTEDQKVEIGTALLISIFSWWGLAGFNLYVIVKGFNEIMKNTNSGKIFKGGFDDSSI